MSKQSKLKNIKSNLESIKDLKFDILYHNGPKVQAYPNHSTNDIKDLVIDTIRVLNALNENENLVKDLSFDSINGINSTINNFVAQFQPLKSLKKEQLINQHHNPLNQLKSLNNSLRQYGIYSIVTPSVDIPLFEDQLKKLSGEASIILKEAEDNAKIIRDLIPDATATSLSTTLRNRATQLGLRVNIWLIIVILVLLGSSYFSWKFLTSNSQDIMPAFAENLVTETNLGKIDSIETKNISTIDSLSIIDKAPKDISTVSTGNETKSKDDNSIVYWIKRIIVFLPLFYLIVFCIRQYNKERKLLEIYTHKRVIAQTLPAYMEQASPNEEVKSELLLRGASMIFTLPENPDTPIQGTDGIAMNELKTMLQIKKEVT